MYLSNDRLEMRMALPIRPILKCPSFTRIYAIRSTIQNLRNWIADIVEATKGAFAEVEAQAKSTSPDLVILLRDYLNLRKAERSD